MAFAESQGMGIRDYLRYTPVNMKEEDKYPYDRPDLWARMTYLPEGLENKRFYLEENNPEGSYLKALNQNYELLKKTSRRSDLARLKKEK
jgi:putative ATPase